MCHEYLLIILPRDPGDHSQHVGHDLAGLEPRHGHLCKHRLIPRDVTHQLGGEVHQVPDDQGQEEVEGLGDGGLPGRQAGRGPGEEVPESF